MPHKQHNKLHLSPTSHRSTDPTPPHTPSRSNKPLFPLPVFGAWHLESLLNFKGHRGDAQKSVGTKTRALHRRITSELIPRTKKYIYWMSLQKDNCSLDTFIFGFLALSFNLHCCEARKHGRFSTAMCLYLKCIRFCSLWFHFGFQGCAYGSKMHAQWQRGPSLGRESSFMDFDFFFSAQRTRFLLTAGEEVHFI